MKVEIKLNEQEYKRFHKQIVEIAKNYHIAMDFGKPELADSILSTFSDQDKYNKGGGVILLSSD